jgi:excisionase family DNA binding protein
MNNKISDETIDHFTLFTLKQVETMLKVSRSTIYRLRKSGQLETTPVRRGVRVSSAQLKALLNIQEI